jgi:two-component system, cell cycle sensor histidine kinase and response regulator CckA
MTKPLRAIFVEDSEDESALLARELRKGDFDLHSQRVDTAEGLRSALQQEEWDLVVSDHSMPGFSGLEALEIVRARKDDLPFIFVSGTMDEETAVLALRQGAQDYLIKGHMQRFLPAVEREMRESADRRDRKRLEQQVAQLQKFEAIGRLAGGIAHDFNNLLGAILGWAEMGLEDTQAGSRARQRFQKITEQAHRAAKLTAQILAFARRQVLQPRKLNLNSAVEDVTSLLHKLIGDRVEIRVLPAETLHSALADPAQIEQVLMNLCLNARDAMPEGGVLLIETHNVEIDAEQVRVHPEARPGRYVLLSVSDTGIGMDKATVERIFEPFFTTKELGRGTGLGLATVYGIVKQHGGFIYVYSEPGKGTAFRLYFPRCEGSAETPEIKAAVELRRGDETILLADDHDGLRQSAYEMLDDLGYHVLTAANGREAVSLFEFNVDRVNLVLLDVMMPEMDGPEAYEHIRALRPDVPVIFTSGYTPDAVPFIAAVGKGSVVLQKPYTLKALSQTIREALDAANPVTNPSSSALVPESARPTTVSKIK